MSMIFKDDRLKTDPELVELRKKFEENFGDFVMPGYSWGIDNGFDEYKQRCKDKYDQLMKERSTK
ncbi:MAG: hypothetical protein PHX08_01835 [Lachnospiraceae bacterium]|nr:hypothetical protein [Lachnospiraceae bacterium]